VHCSIGDRRVSWIDSDRLALVGAHRPLLQHRDRGADKVGRWAPNAPARPRLYRARERRGVRAHRHRRPRPPRPDSL